MGRKGPRAKTKIVLKSVKQWEQLGNMHNLKFQTFPNKNHPNNQPSVDALHRICNILGLPNPNCDKKECKSFTILSQNTDTMWFSPQTNSKLLTQSLKRKAQV